MVKQFLSLIIIGLVFNLALCSTARANTDDGEKVKNEIVKIGVLKNTKVKIILADGSKQVGFLTEIKDKSFVLLTDPDRNYQEYQYAQVTQINRKNSKGKQRLFALALIGGFLYIVSNGAARGN